MPKTVMTVEASERFLKTVFFVLVLSVLLYGVALKLVQIPATSRPPGNMNTGLMIVAGTTALIVLYLRFKKIGALLSPDVATPSPERLGRTQALFILCFVLSQSVALYGFVLGFMGAETRDVLPFFVGALVLFALCYPRLSSDSFGR